MLRTLCINYIHAHAFVFAHAMLDAMYLANWCIGNNTESSAKPGTSLWHRFPLRKYPQNKFHNLFVFF